MQSYDRTTTHVAKSSEYRASATYGTYNKSKDHVYVNPDTPTSKRVKPIDLFGNATTRRFEMYQNRLVTPGKGLSGGITYWYPECYTGALSLPPGVPTTIDSSHPVERKMLLQIKDQKTNLTVSIAEIGKTSDMVWNFARETLGFLRSARKGRFGDAIRAIKHPRTRSDKALASRWLEMQYGWIPTMYDIQGLSDLIYQKIVSGYITGHTHHRVKGFYDLRAKNPYVPALKEGQFGAYLLRNSRHFRYKVDSPGLKTMAASGISNPALVVWELVPYSFVMDWFVDVGDYLSSLDALVGISDFKVIRSMYLKTETEIWSGVDNIPGPLYPTVSTGVQVRAYRDAPVSTVRYYRPVYNPHLSVKRMISATALIRNLFK